MKIQGVKKLVRSLKQMPIEARKEIGPAIDKGADELVRLQRAAAPKDKFKLVRSIRKEKGGTRIGSQLKGDAGLSTAVVAGGPLTTKEVRSGSGVSYDYALAGEFGTSDTPAQPYFYGPYRLIKRRIKSRITRATTKSAKKAAGK